VPDLATSSEEREAVRRGSGSTGADSSTPEADRANLQAEVRALIDALSDTGNLTEGAVVVWEHDSADDADWPPWIEPLFDLQYGSTRVDAGTYSRGDVR